MVGKKSFFDEFFLYFFCVLFLKIPMLGYLSQTAQHLENKTK